MRYLITGFFLFFCSSTANSYVNYAFSHDPIDIVIPCAEKDIPLLDLCIEGIEKNVENLGRIILVSKEPYTDKAEWFNEELYPFTKFDLGLAIYNQDEEKAEEFALKCPRVGGVYQQFLKLYAPFVIPNISSNVLIVDADVIFYRSVKFTGKGGAGLYNVGDEYHEPYFKHMHQLLPELNKVFPEYSGICHHMLFQRVVLEDLFSMIETRHGVPAWQAICQCIDQREILRSSFSEYEIYFNFVFSQTRQVKVRPLKWLNAADISPKKRAYHKSSGFDYVAYHAYLR